jgi:hypothetical protein
LTYIYPMRCYSGQDQMKNGMFKYAHKDERHHAEQEHLQKKEASSMETNH